MWIGTFVPSLVLGSVALRSLNVRRSPTARRGNQEKVRRYLAEAYVRAARQTSEVFVWFDAQEGRDIEWTVLSTETTQPKE